MGSRIQRLIAAVVITAAFCASALARSAAPPVDRSAAPPVDKSQPLQGVSLMPLLKGVPTQPNDLTLFGEKVVAMRALWDARADENDVEL